MGKLTTDVFQESCCDGGASANDNSCQLCGCDPRAHWVCERHQHEGVQDVFGATDESAEPFAFLIGDHTRTNGHAQGPHQERAEQQPSVAPEPGLPQRSALPTDPRERKQYPIYSGVLKYFPDAIAEIAHVSYIGNKQHNPGEPLHWAREKSTDQEDCIIRHLMQAGTLDTDGVSHLAKAAWRCLAALQLELERRRS